MTWLCAVAHTGQLLVILPTRLRDPSGRPQGLGEPAPARRHPRLSWVTPKGRGRGRVCRGVGAPMLPLMDIDKMGPTDPS